jgi:hypothetical protein
MHREREDGHEDAKTRRGAKEKSEMENRKFEKRMFKAQWTRNDEKGVAVADAVLYLYRSSLCAASQAFTL